MWFYRIDKRNMFALIAVVCILIAILATVFYVYATSDEAVNISLNGDPVVTLALGQEYIDPGAVAHLGDQQMQQIPVEGTGNVDTDCFGVYYIKYKFEYDDQTVTAYRCVRVEDKTAPQILLVENEDSFTQPGEPYAEAGFTATDDVDGDITHLVRRSEVGGRVIYSVSDSAGNQTTVERLIRYQDKVAPQVAVKGDMVVSVAVGQTYQEPGYTATDNLEGDITGYVTVEGSVDTGKAGVYTLRYRASDSDGNTGAAERIVHVLSGEDAVQPNGKVIYLTFDDGPSIHTDRLLDVLAKYNVKATFFVVNTAMIDTVERIAAEGHSVGIHSTTHKYRQIYASEEAYFNDLYNMQAVIEEYTGERSTLLRFPGGTSNTVSRRYSRGIMTRLSQQVEEQGFRYFDWNVDSKDAGGAKTTQEVVDNVLEGVGKNSVSVVLQHDLYGYSVDAVEEIITWGLKNGFTFAPLTQASPACEHEPNN